MCSPVLVQRLAGVVVMALAVAVLPSHRLSSAPDAAWSLAGGGACFVDGTAYCNETGNATDTCSADCEGPGSCPNDYDGYEHKSYDKAEGGQDTGKVGTMEGTTTCGLYYCTATCQPVGAGYNCNISTNLRQNDNRTTSEPAGAEDPGA